MIFKTLLQNVQWETRSGHARCCSPSVGDLHHKCPPAHPLASYTKMYNTADLSGELGSRRSAVVGSSKKSYVKGCFLVQSTRHLVLFLMFPMPVSSIGLFESTRIHFRQGQVNHCLRKWAFRCRAKTHWQCISG